jgi:hypothetical protein
MLIRPKPSSVQARRLRARLHNNRLTPRNLYIVAVVRTVAFCTRSSDSASSTDKNGARGSETEFPFGRREHHSESFSVTIYLALDF